MKIVRYEERVWRDYGMRYPYDHDMDLARRFTGERARNPDEMAFAIFLGA